MTSLFGILIAAARGEMPAVEPPPRHRFHEREPVGAIEWREDVRADDPPNSPLPPPPPGRTEQRPAASANGPNADLPAKSRRPDRVPPPPSVAALAEPARKFERAETQPLHKPAAGDRGSRKPARDATREARRESSAATPAKPFVPLLERRTIERTLETRQVIERARGERQADGLKSPRLALSIGRIEVRPLPQTASRPPAHPPTRPVVLRRAAVRETLDQYRARQKR